MKSIAIIGAGQLGSRHLQSLARLSSTEFNVFVVDLSEESLAVAKQRYEEVRTETSPLVSYLSDWQALPKEFFLAIIATGSLPRRSLTERLLAHAKVSFLLLEKFLFPKIEDYKAIGLLLQRQDVQAYVNTPRRMVPFYSKLKTVLEGPIHMEVSGTNWGLGCNAIHFLDLFVFLCNSHELEVISNLNSGVIESKRTGYIEFTGSLVIRDELKNTLILSSFESGIRKNIVSIADRNRKVNIHENELNKAFSFERVANQHQYVEYPITIPLQSESTALFVKELMQNGSSLLPDFNTSSYQHIKLLEVFMHHYNETLKEKTDLCPIT